VRFLQNHLNRTDSQPRGVKMSNPLILVAEDEADVRTLLVEAFSFSGFSVVEVPDGAQAVKEAPKVKPDLILLDVRMPNMTGLEACKILKTEESTKNIPVVFLSAYGQEADINAGLALGAEAYLVKPFALNELVTRINKVLKKYGKG
jgi:CheY-like chemotaxis protein